MPFDAFDSYTVAYKNGTTTMLALVAGVDGTALVQADIATISYSIFLLDDQDPDSRTDIANHTAVAVAVAATIFDTLQTDALWECDDTGYNFRHTIDITPNAAFEIAGRNYLIEYIITTAAGPVILLRGRASVI